MVLEENTKKEITDISSNVDCKREQGEKQKIIDLGKNLEGLNTPEKIDDRVECKNLLGSQKLGNSDQTLEDFLKKDIKSILEKKKTEFDSMSESSKNSDGVKTFINSIGQEIQDICGNKNDKVAILQVYLNSISDVNLKYAKIPYDSKKYDYKQGENKRLFIDGILGPHTYNALWLATFGDELPKIELTRKQSYDFGREEPRIIGKDLPYIPLTLPGLDKSGNVESNKNIEIIDNPKIKGAIELLYLFYDGVSKKDNLGIDIDDEIMKIMTNPKLYNNDNGTANPLNGYIIAIRDLNGKIAGDKSDLKEGKLAINKFINDKSKFEDAEMAVLNELEYNIGVHEYVANYIAEKRIDLSQDKNKSKMEGIKLKGDKQYIKYNDKVNKQWLEQEKVQRVFISKMFTEAIQNANTVELKANLCEMFGVDSIDKIDNALINKKVDEAIEIAGKDFKSQMLDTYFKKRFLEEEIRSDKSNLDGLSNYSGKDRDKLLFADIQGIGYANPSSENMETAIFRGQMIAEEAACFAIGMVTAGFGGVALKTALYGRRAMKIARIAVKVEEGVAAGRKLSKINKLKILYKSVNQAEKVVRAERALTLGGKAINATTTILGVAVGGAAFYEGTNTMQNIIKDVPMFQGWDDYPEITKSIAMFGALKLVNKLVATSKIVSVGGKEFNVNPFNKLATKNTDKIFTRAGKIAGESVVGGTAIFAVEHMGDAIIEEDEAHPWTKEEFIQAVLMYMIFRGAGEAGKLKITKNKKTGKPEIQKENPKQLTEGAKNPEPKQLTEGAKKSETKKITDGKEKEIVKKTPKKELTPEQITKLEAIDIKIKGTKSYLEGQQNELNVAKSKLDYAVKEGNIKLEKKMTERVFAMEQDIKFNQLKLNNELAQRELILNN